LSKDRSQYRAEPTGALQIFDATAVRFSDIKALWLEELTQTSGTSD
jgi:hypothetical protein